MEFIIFATVFITVSFLYLVRLRSTQRLPAGPKGWPIFGNTFQVNLSKMALQIANIGRDFGDAYTVQFLDHKFVILNSYKFIKELMTSKEYGAVFSGRPKTFLGQYCFKKEVVLQDYTRQFIDLKKLLLRGMRSHDTSMADTEQLVQQELKHLVCRINKEAGTSVDPYVHIDYFVCSLILMSMSGRHYEEGHPLLHLLDQITDDIDYLASPKVNAVMTSFPFLHKLRVGYGAVSHRLMTNLNLLVTTILNIKKGDRRDCILDFILSEKLKGNIDDEHVKGIILDIMAAGTGTIRTTLSSMLLILASRPEVQDIMQKEIDQEIGTSRLPCVKDKHKLPYTRSVVTEVLRFFTTAPLSILHSTTRDVQIGEYLLPEGTEVFYNIWQVLHDESFWEKPWEFNPSRFLDQWGNYLPLEDEKHKRMLAFGLGKRKCAGEKMAKIRLFLTCVTVLQNFTIHPDPQRPLPEADPRTFHADLALKCPKFNVIFKSRKNKECTEGNTFQ